MDDSSQMVGKAHPGANPEIAPLRDPLPLEFQVPQAVITLKQGAGRLIRDETDRGALMICDTRLVERPYGRRIWQSLPAMRRTRELDEVLAFFAAINAGQAREARDARVP